MASKEGESAGAKAAAKEEAVGDERLENSDSVEGWLSGTGCKSGCGIANCVGRTPLWGPFWAADSFCADSSSEACDACTCSVKEESESLVETGDIFDQRKETLLEENEGFFLESPISPRAKKWADK